VLDNVDITSDGLAFVLVRGVKIAAKASSVTALGKLAVTDMGRWREKKDDAAISSEMVSISKKMLFNKPYIPSFFTWFVLGTLGRFGMASFRAFTTPFPATSFAFLRLDLAAGFLSPSE
jgi:hypothetical protein